MKASLIQANALQIPLADKSVHMVVTSPPYWSLRDYGTAQWVGGSHDCDHTRNYRTADSPGRAKSTLGGGRGTNAENERSVSVYKDVCQKCGAQRIDKQLGLEPLHDCGGWATGNNCGKCYVCNMRAVMGEVWRVLRDDGTLFLNLGDSYNGSGGAGGDYNPGGLKDGQPKYPGHKGQGLKPKDLVGIPWRVALALQADGWYLRSDIIWNKPNPMPESVTDRPTKAHEYLFLLAKQERYYYDADAVREEAILGFRLSEGGFRGGGSYTNNQSFENSQKVKPAMPPLGYDKSAGRNRRTVWEIPTMPYSANAEISRARRVARDAVSCGTRHIVLPSCPAHGGLFAQVARDFYGEHEADLLSRIQRTCDHLVQARRSGYVPTPRQPDAATAAGSWGYSPREYSPSAIDHSNEIHRMALELGTTPAYIPFAEIADRIDDRSKLLVSFVQHLCIYGSNILPDDLDAHLLSRTPSRIVDKSYVNHSSGAYVPPECECLFYEYYTRNSDHFATYPPALVEPCIKAGTSERGVCPECGAPWRRVVEREWAKDDNGLGRRQDTKQLTIKNKGASSAFRTGGHFVNDTTGWLPSCTCPAADPVPAIVLDPFNGSGTTGMVAQQLGRRYVGLDLSAEYLKLAQERTGITAWDEWTNGKRDGANLSDLPMFAKAGD